MMNNMGKALVLVHVAMSLGGMTWAMIIVSLGVSRPMLALSSNGRVIPAGRQSKLKSMSAGSPPSDRVLVRRQVRCISASNWLAGSDLVP